MKFADMKAAMDIVQPYYKKPNASHLTVDRDQLMISATDHPMSAQDVERMLKLRWFQEYGAQEGSADAYDADSAWQHDGG